MSGFFGSWVAEDDSTDYLGIVTGLCASVIALAQGIPMTVIALVTSCGLISYEFIMTYAIIAGELVGIKEWWGTEHTVLFIWLALCVPAFCKRSSGNCQEMLLQLVSGLSALLIFGCFLQLANGLQGGEVFGGKLQMPTMALLAVTVAMFGANMDGIKKEIYGYGVSDVPADERCALVFDSIKKFIGFEAAIFLIMATLGLPPLNVEGENCIAWLAAIPIIGMLLEMNSYFAPEVEEIIVAEVATDLNGLPPQPQEEEGKDAEEEKGDDEGTEEGTETEEKNEADDKIEEGVELIKEGVKEKVEKIEAEIKEAIQEKIDAEPEKAAIISKICDKVKGVVGCVKNLILAVVGKVTSIISCILGHVLALPWNCIINTSICLGTQGALLHCRWLLTEDCVVLAFPIIDLVLPYLISKAKGRQWLTDNAGHLLSESAALVAGLTQYYLFRTYIQQPI